MQRKNENPGKGLSMEIMERPVGNWEVALSSCRSRLCENEELLTVLLCSLPTLLDFLHSDNTSEGHS